MGCPPPPGEPRNSARIQIASVNRRTSFSFRFGPVPFGGREDETDAGDARAIAARCFGENGEGGEKAKAASQKKESTH